jgi:hypothetical protein
LSLSPNDHGLRSIRSRLPSGGFQNLPVLLHTSFHALISQIGISDSSLNQYTSAMVESSKGLGQKARTIMDVIMTPFTFFFLTGRSAFKTPRFKPTVKDKKK